MRLTIKLTVLILMGSLIFCPNVLAGISDDLVAHYLFDNSSNDETDLENHGEPKGSGDFTEDRFGRKVFAYDFVKDNSIYIDLGKNDSLRPTELNPGATIAAWIRLDTTTGELPIFANNGTEANGFFLKVSGGKVVFGFGDGAKGKRSITSFDSLNANVWYHVAGVVNYDGTTLNLKLYIDNKEDDRDEKLGTITKVARDENVPGYIGRIDNQYFDGKIDDVRFYNAPKSKSEITQLYNGEILIDLPESVTEADEVLEDIGKITIYKAAGTSGLTFTLRSSDEKKIKVGNVTIPSGQKEATFDLTLVDNDEVDEDKEVTITVRRSSFIQSSAKINVKDDETMGCFITTLLN